MDAYVLNGLYSPGYFDDPLQGTNQVMPLQGTNQVVPMQGTNQVMPLQGTNQVVPMQGLYGEYYVDPLVLMDEDDVPLQGIPGDYDDDDVEAYKLAYLMGDPDAMQGLFSKVKERRKGRREARAARREERRAMRKERRAIRTEKMRSGTGFLDKLGAGIGAVGGGLLKKAGAIADETMDELDEAGIDFDPGIVEQRAFMAAEAGADAVGTDTTGAGAGAGTGLMARFNALPMGGKIAVVGGIGLLGFLAYKSLTKKKGRK